MAETGVTELGRAEEPPRQRGKGKGSRFFVLGREVWRKLTAIPSASPMNLILTYLVLAAGTGADQRLTKWSAHACETYLGIGKPRAQYSIRELFCEPLIEEAEPFDPMRPQYRLPDVSDDPDPIFLPVQLITGLARETPILRRVRETGDVMALRMLIDLYGLIQCDATGGVPIRYLRATSLVEPRRLAETGVNVLWGLSPPTDDQDAFGQWRTIQEKGKDAGPGAFWERLALLRKIGAVRYEPWLFDGDGEHAEPLFPLDVACLDHVSPDAEALSDVVTSIAELMTEDRDYLLDRYDDALCIPRTAHQQAPAAFGVAKLRVEADTPGARLAYRRRKELIASNLAAYEALLGDLEDGIHNRPLASRRVAAA